MKKPKNAEECALMLADARAEIMGLRADLRMEQKHVAGASNRIASMKLASEVMLRRLNEVFSRQGGPAWIEARDMIKSQIIWFADEFRMTMDRGPAADDTARLDYLAKHHPEVAIRISKNAINPPALRDAIDLEIEAITTLPSA